MSRAKVRIIYALCSVLLFAVEIIIATYFKRGFIRHWLGDFLVVALLYCSVQAIWPGKILKRIALVAVIAIVIESLQAVNILELLGLREHLALRLLFGTTFSWGDMLAYFLGLLTVLAVERLVRSEGFVQCYEIVLGPRKQV